MEKKMSKVVVGSKGVALTTEAIYNVAHRLCVVELDSSSLDRLARSKPNIVLVEPDEIVKRLAQDPTTRHTPFHTRGSSSSVHEVRAILVVVLHKLLQGPYGIRTFLPIFIMHVLNSNTDIPDLNSNVEFAVIVVLVHAFMTGKSFQSLGDAMKINILSLRNICLVDEAAANKVELDSAKDDPGIDVDLSKLKVVLEEADAGEIGLTADEIAALESIFATSTGVAALASHALDSLILVADAFLALSCEALQADTGALESPSALKQTSFVKSEVDVATDLTSLLFGSKLVKARKGGADASYVKSVPAEFGALRDSVKNFASRLRIEINRVAGSSATSSSSLDTSTLLSLLASLWPVVAGCLERTFKSCELAGELSIESSFYSVRRNDPIAIDFSSLSVDLQSAAGAAFVTSGNENKVLLLSNVTLSAVELWKRVLAKECAAALTLLSIRERRVAAGQDGEPGKGKFSEEDRAKSAVAAAGKAPKQRKSFVLGKGTDRVRQSLAGYMDARVDKKFAMFDALSMMEKNLGALLNPHVSEFQALIAEVKSVLESNDVRRLPKIAKGTRDFKPEQMAIRERAFGIVATVFKRHGAVALDTPVFELRETLMGKYGEDSKLIYDLADQGGEILSLRYDLTVPLARYLAMNKVENLKRYHIAKVYRRDNPAKGRFREFYQCDVDIAGQYPLMVPDFEVLKVLTELLDELSIGDYEVKLNHRRLLDGMLDICGVPQAKFRSICSAIDKLDKLPWEQVHKEMVEEKGLTPETADKIGELVQKRGHPLVLLQELKEIGSPFLNHSGSSSALEDLGVLFRYLEAAKCVDRIVLDLSLARGLDYYTGVIYEAVFKGATQVGSIAAGGRYDNLVGMFGAKQIPAVGVSLGIERVFTIMEQQEADRRTLMRSNETEVLLVVLGNDVKWTEIAIEIVTELWKGKVKAEFKCVARAKLTQQITNAATSGIPWVVIVGEDEINAGIVRLRDISAKQQQDVRREDLVTELQRQLGVVSMLPPFVP